MTLTETAGQTTRSETSTGDATGARIRRQVPVQNRVVLLVDEIHALRNLPVVIADRLGYFSDNGLDVTVMNLRYDVSHQELLASGRVDAVMAYYHHNLANRAAGVDSHAVVTLAVTPAMRLLVGDSVRGKVRDATDLAGRSVITGGIKSAKSTTAAWLALQGGVSLDSFTQLPTLGREANAALLRAGAADLIVAPAHEAGYYESRGVAHLLADLVDPESTTRTLGTLCPTSTVFMSDQRAADRPDFAQHLANVFVRTLDYMHKHTAEQLSDLVPDAVLGKEPDRAGYRRQIEAVRGMFAGDGTMPVDGVAREHHVLQELHPGYRGVVLDRTYTNEFALRSLQSVSVRAE